MPALTAPSRYIIPEVETGMLSKLWYQMEEGQQCEILKIEQNQVFYELDVKFSQMYGQGAYLESFTDHLRPINLTDALLCAKHSFSEQIKSGSTTIAFEDSLFQASVDTTTLDHSKKCFACERDDAVYTFSEDGEGTLIHGVTALSAHSLALFFWAATSVLMKRLAIAGDSRHVIGTGFTSVPQLRSTLTQADPYKAVLNQAIKLKEQGNDLFREKRWDLANRKYTEAIECSCMLDSSRLTYFSNRALCALFMASEEIEDRELRTEYLSSAILDCTTVLQHKSNDIKALYRRAKAFLELGDTGKAFRDLSNLLSLNPEQDDAKALLERLTFLPQHTDIISEIEGTFSKPQPKKAPKAKKTANGKKKKKKAVPEPSRPPQISFSKMLTEDPIRAIEEFNKAAAVVKERQKREEEERLKKEEMEKEKMLKLKEDKERKEREKRERKEELRKMQEMREKDRREKELREADERERLRIERETVIREKEKTDRRIKEEVDKRIKEDRAREEERRRSTKEKERLRRLEKEEERKKKKALKKEQKNGDERKPKPSQPDSPLESVTEVPPPPPPPPTTTTTASSSINNIESGRRKVEPITIAPKMGPKNIFVKNKNTTQNGQHHSKRRPASHPTEELPLHKRKIEPPRKDDPTKQGNAISPFDQSEDASQFHFDIELFQRYGTADVSHPTAAVPQPPPDGSSPAASCLDIETLFKELQGSFSSNGDVAAPSRPLFTEASTEGFICPPPPTNNVPLGGDPWGIPEEVVSNNTGYW